MITGELELLSERLSAESYKLIVDYVMQVQKNEITLGQWEMFDDTQVVKAIVLTSGATSAEVMEFHRKYIDLHITVEGADYMHVGDQITEIVQEYEEEADYCLVKSARETVYEIAPNHFIMLQPEEAHVNILRPESKKIVFKLKPNA